MRPLKNIQEGKQYIGKKVEVTKDISGHKIPIGTILKLFTIGMHKTSIVFYAEEYDRPLKTQEIAFIDVTLEALEEELKELDEYYKSKKKMLNAKIDFMKIKEIEVFDEEQYLIYTTLKSIENAGSEEEKEELLKRLSK